MSTPRRATTSAGRPDPARAARLQRDAGLERGRTITKGVAFGSVAAVAVAGIYLSQALPGHAASPGTTVPSGTSGAGGTAGAGATSGAGSSSGSGAVPAGSGISAPAAVPAPSNQQAPVVSGSS
jgi:hypothetical protein